MIAFLIGYKGGNALLGSTMAFATLCSARLFHGFNCKSDRPVVFTSKLLNNIYLIGAFVVGLALVTMVVMIPGLHSIFKSTDVEFDAAFDRIRPCGSEYSDHPDFESNPSGAEEKRKIKLSLKDWFNRREAEGYRKEDFYETSTKTKKAIDRILSDSDCGADPF